MSKEKKLGRSEKRQKSKDIFWLAMTLLLFEVVCIIVGLILLFKYYLATRNMVEITPSVRISFIKNINKVYWYIIGIAQGIQFIGLIALLVKRAGFPSPYDKSIKTLYVLGLLLRIFALCGYILEIKDNMNYNEYEY